LLHSISFAVLGRQTRTNCSTIASVMKHITIVSLIVSTVCSGLILVVGLSQMVDDPSRSGGAAQCPCDDPPPTVTLDIDGKVYRSVLRRSCDKEASYRFPYLHRLIPGTLVGKLEGTSGLLLMMFFFSSGGIAALFSCWRRYRFLLPAAVSTLSIALALFYARSVVACFS
jgi:hypothetical protein